MKQRGALLLFLGTALLISGPLFLQRGYIFLLDWVGGPQSHFPTDWTARETPLSAALWLLDILLPYGISQKLILLCIFFLAGYGTYRLIPTQNPWVKVFAGLFAQFNPFIYTRILAGQWSLVLGLAVLPWILHYTVLFIEEPKRSHAIRLTLFFTVAAILHPAIALVSIMWTVALLIARLINHPSPLFRRALYRGVLDLAILALVVNAFWLVPWTLSKRTSGNIEVSTPAPSHTIYKTRLTTKQRSPLSGRTISSEDSILNAVALYGTWGSDAWRYRAVELLRSPPPFAFWPILALAIWGGIVATTHLSRKADSPTPTPFLSSPLALRAIGIVGLLFVILSAKPWPASAFSLAPHTFVASVVMTYAFFAARGIEDLLERLNRLPTTTRWWWLHLIAPGLLLLLPLVISFKMLFGFQGKLSAREYPQGWYASEQYLKNDPDAFYVLFLPWQPYLRFSFTTTPIANPAPHFFSKPVLTPESSSLSPLQTAFKNPESKIVEQILDEHLLDPTLTARALKILGVKYVLVPVDPWLGDAYRWLKRQEHINLVLDTPEMQVYQNQLFEPIK